MTSFLRIGVYRYQVSYRHDTGLISRYAGTYEGFQYPPPILQPPPLKNRQTANRFAISAPLQQLNTLVSHHLCLVHNILTICFSSTPGIFTWYRCVLKGNTHTAINWGKKVVSNIHQVFTSTQLS